MRVHGLLLYNFCTYGEDNNVVEFSRGSSYFFKHGKNISDWLNLDVVARAKEKLKEWTLDESSRILSIVGQTDGDPALSNGTGKSTIIEGIVYALYEKMIRDFVHKDSTKGSSTMSIVPDNRDVQCAYVELLFSANNNLWLLQRGRKVTKTGHTAMLEVRCLTDEEENKRCSAHRNEEMNDYIIKLVRMDFDSCCNSVLFGQNDAGRFLTGTDKERKEIFISVLQLDIINRYLDEIRKNRKKKCNEEMVALQAMISMLQEQIKDEGGVKDIQTKISVAQQGISGADKQLLEVAELISAIQSAPEVQAHATVAQQIKLVEQVVEAIYAKYAAEESSLTKTSAELVKSKASKQADLDKKNKELAEVAKAIAASDKVVSAFKEDEYKQEIAKVEKAKTAKPEREKELSAAQDALNGFVAKESSINTDIRSHNERHEALKEILAKGDGGKIRCPECEGIVSVEHVREKIAEHVSATSKLREELATQSKLKEATQTKISELKQRLKNIEAYLDKESDLRLSFQKFETEKANKANAEERKAALNDSVSELILEVSTLQSKIDDATSQSAGLNAKKDEEAKGKRDELESLKKSLADAEQAKKSNDEKLSKANARKAEYQKEKELLIAEKAALEAKVEQIAAKEKKIVELNASVVEQDKLMQRLKYLEWLFGPNGIQTQLIQRYLPLLNKYVNEYLSLVSDLRMDIVADVGESEKLKFNISGNSSARLEGLSGGEFVKIRLAVNIALGLLSFVRRKDVPEFICLDEVLAPVDTKSKDLVFDLLKHLQGRFKDIVLISHHPAILERIKEVIVVNKVNGISRISNGNKNS